MEAPTNRVSYFGAIELDSGRQADSGLPQNSSDQCQAGPSQDLITFEGVAQQLRRGGGIPTEFRNPQRFEPGTGTGFGAPDHGQAGR